MGKWQDTDPFLFKFIVQIITASIKQNTFLEQFNRNRLFYTYNDTYRAYLPYSNHYNF